MRWNWIYKLIIVDFVDLLNFHTDGFCTYHMEWMWWILSRFSQLCKNLFISVGCIIAPNLCMSFILYFLNFEFHQFKFWIFRFWFMTKFSLRSFFFHRCHDILICRSLKNHFELVTLTAYTFKSIWVFFSWQIFASREKRRRRNHIKYKHK